MQRREEAPFFLDRGVLPNGAYPSLALHTTLSTFIELYNTFKNLKSSKTNYIFPQLSRKHTLEAASFGKEVD